MKITAITIENFRSINEIELPLEDSMKQKCRILLGVNESGKSNFLKAIALLDENLFKDIKYSKDCNKEGEKNGQPIVLTYYLEIENLKSFAEKLVEQGIPETLAKKIKINTLYRMLYIDSDDRHSDSVEFYLQDDPIFEGYLIKEGKIQPISEVYDGDVTLTKENIEQFVGPNTKLLSKIGLETIIEEKFKNTIKGWMPKVIFWEYDEKYLLNKPIDLNAFATDQSISVPLRNIFHIAGIKEIGSRIKLISASMEKTRQLEEELTTSITNYINNVWREHEVNLKVCIENMQCAVLIEDKDDTAPKYNINQRSDGFKQFISILLNLSAENATEQMKGSLVLIDEPEVHLHPSGVRYLRDELLKISENNTVFIATHSIYMVDRQNLGRHFKVEKNRSKTVISQIPDDNPYMEEVIYESLGTSIYELIEPNMIVFEGKTDKDLFDAFTAKFKQDIKPKNVGTISADGVDKMPRYTKFFNGKMVNGFFVTDSDQTGKDYKKIMIDSDTKLLQKKVFEINDILDQKKKVTLEDLFPIDIIEKCLLDQFKVSLTLDPNQPVMDQIERKNKELKGKMDPELVKKELTRGILKDIAKLTKEEAKKKYSVYLAFASNLHKKLG